MRRHQPIAMFASDRLDGFCQGLATEALAAVIHLYDERVGRVDDVPAQASSNPALRGLG